MDQNDPLVLLVELEVKQKKLERTQGLLRDCRGAYDDLIRRFKDLDARFLGRGQEILRLTKLLEDANVPE